MTDTPHSTRQADALIDALAKEGTVDSAGTFTVDASRAQALLEGFRLAEPSTFVLALLRVAVLGGATRFEARIDQDEVEITFDGAPIAPAALEDLQGLLLTAAQGTADRRRAALAEGLFGAEVLPAHRVELSADGPEGGALLVRQPREADTVSPKPPVAKATTRITVRRRAEAPGDAVPGWEPAEAELLSRRGRFAPLALEVNGRRVATLLETEGHRLSAELGLPHALFVTPVTGDGLEGAAGIEEEPHPPAWVIVQDGAVIAEEPLEAAPPGFVALVRSPAIRRDLGLARAVKDAAWQAAERAVLEARREVLERARRMISLSRDRRTAEGLGLARRTLRTAFLAGLFEEGRLVEDLAIFPVFGRGASTEHTSITALRSLAKRKGRLAAASIPPEDLSPAARRVIGRRRGVLRLDDAAEREPLAARLGVAVESLDAALAAARPEAPGPLRRMFRQLDALGCALIVALVVVLGASTYFYRALQDEQTWPRVPGQVLEAKHRKTTTGSGSKRRTVYRVSLRYRFQLGGRTHENTDKGFRDHRKVEDAEAHVARLRSSGVQIWVNPRDPTEVRYELTDPAQALYAGGFGTLVILVVIGVVLTRNRRRLAAEAEKEARVVEASLEEQVGRIAQQARPQRSRKRKRGRR